MKRIKKMTALLVILALSAVVATGCGSEEPEATTSAPAATEKEATNETTATEAEAAETMAWMPEEDITIRVPSAAGGGFDTFVRIFAKGIQESMDSTTIVTNLPGANGTVAFGDLINYDPSPYELMGGNIGQFTTAPLFNPANSLDLDNFELLGSLASGEFCLYVSPQQTGIETFEDLIEYSKDNEVLIGSQPPGSAVHALVTYVFGESGVNYSTVISDGANKDIISVVNGDITVSVGYPNVGRQYVQEGTIIPILTFSGEPCVDFEGLEVPTAKSQGIDLAFRANNFVMARKGADTEALKAMFNAFIEWQETESFKELADNTKYVPYNQNGEELKAEIERAAELFQVIYDKYYKQ